MAKRRAHGEGSLYQRKSDGRWVGTLTVGYDDEGKQRRLVVYGATQRKAREKLDKLREQYNSGTLSETRQSVAQYLHHWLEAKSRTVRPRTLELYADLIRLHIRPRIGHVRLDRLKPLQVQQMVNAIHDDVGASTANKARRVLHGALKQAVKWQMIPRNVVEAVEPLPEPRREMVIWSPEEARRFLDTAKTHRLYAAFYLAMATGLRRGEILGLRWDDLVGNALHIRRTLTTRGGKPVWSTPKTAKGERLVIVPADALAVLEEHRRRQAEERYLIRGLGEPWADDTLVFANTRGDVTTPTAFQHHWKRLQEKANVPEARLHDLRHLHVSLLVQQGFDPRTIADRVGHADASFTLRRYAHMFEQQRKAAAVDLEKLLG